MLQSPTPNVTSWYCMNSTYNNYKLTWILWINLFIEESFSWLTDSCTAGEPADVDAGWAADGLTSLMCHQFVSDVIKHPTLQLLQSRQVPLAACYIPRPKTRCLSDPNQVGFGSQTNQLMSAKVEQQLLTLPGPHLLFVSCSYYVARLAVPPLLVLMLC